MLFKGRKIAVGYEIKDGPWGGGNQFLVSFKDHFEKQGAQITSKLEDGLDLIILFNPRKGSGSFTHQDVLRYKRRNPKVKAIFRFNDTDLSGKNYRADKLRLSAAKSCDGVIFISEWLRDYYIEKGFNSKLPNAVIYNGADQAIFNRQGYTPWQKGNVMKIVTHHWSDNCMKGADIYQYLDDLLEDPWMRERFEFTYIGRLPRVPREVHFKNTRHISSLSGNELANELKKHHVYLTAARWEGCGMHQLEGACCGLPVLFIDEGGGAVETCKEFGIQFKKDNFTVSLFKMLEEYHQLQPKMSEFYYSSVKMCQEYEKFISSLFKGKE